jgi:hypothetical protein
VATLITGSGVDKVIDGSIVDADIVGVSSSKLTGALPAVDGSALTNMAAGGKVLQVVQGVVTASSLYSTASGATTPNLVTATLTPSSTTSKVLVSFSLSLASTTSNISAILNREGTDISIADAQGSRKRVTASSDLAATLYGQVNLTSTYLDDPTIPTTPVAITYGVKAHHGSGGTKIIYQNRTQNYTDGSDKAVTVSSLTLMEIGA